ncbi:MAG: nucleotidyl transferase AbiEii/AbiGii toxin family protein [Bdellovibrionales bacterium]
MNEQSLKEKLRSIANKKESTFQEVWKKLVLERFLTRLSKSPCSDKFIFKGGLLLSYYLEIGRETKDIDFLVTQVNANEDQIKFLLVEVADVTVDDGFSFSFNKIDQLDQVHMNYPGYRVKMNTTFGNMKDTLQIDVGVGDKVTPGSLDIPLIDYEGGPLFDGTIALQVYPTETIFAEKLETLIYRGAANSRMKDYHDLLFLCESNILNVSETKRQVDTTFSHRKTKKLLPIEFVTDDINKLQGHWERHLKTLTTEVSKKLPSSIVEVITSINTWIETAGIS